ncbi:MAG: Ig-like domain-containing protein [Candidatus Nanopelagicales bacterium]
MGLLRLESRARRTTFLATSVATALAISALGVPAAQAEETPVQDAPANTAPVTAPDAATVVLGNSVKVEPVENDTDADLGDTLTLTGAALASGRATVARSGQSVTITPSALGTVTVDYTIADTAGATARGVITVTVRPAPNKRPLAKADSVRVTAGTSVKVKVLANDRDPEGQRITLVKVYKAKHGTARTSGSKVYYKAAKSWTGRTKVTYKISDSKGATDKGLLTVTVVKAKKPKPAPKPPASKKTPSRAAVESALARLRLPTGSPNGSYDAATRRAVCAWRTVTGRTAHRGLPSASESRAIVGTRSLPRPRPSMVPGVNVSVTCQAAFWVKGDRYRRVMAATTGKPGYRTRLGIWRIFRTYHVWRYSTIYPQARMYKPMQFSGGQAIHGSSTDRLVKTYPASHGCVRMLHRDVDALQAGGVGNGTRVRVFGAW